MRCLSLVAVSRLLLCSAIGCGSVASTPVDAGVSDAPIDAGPFDLNLVADLSASADLIAVADFASTADGSACTGPAAERSVSFTSSDGLALHATWINPCGSSPAPAVVLLHQMCSSRAEWSDADHNWVEALRARKIATLAVDLRGHGGSKAWPSGGTHDLCAELFDPSSAGLYGAMVDDAKASIAHARSLGATAVAVVGASIGANSALVAYSEDATLVFAVGLSPGLDYRGIQTLTPIRVIGSRPILLEAADDDSDSADDVRALKSANSSVTTQIWSTGGHGNTLIATHPTELSRIADLLANAL